MKKQTLFRKTLIAAFIGALGSHYIAQAAVIPLVQYPPGSASREPAPNVIISVDDSGSMEWDVASSTVRADTDTRQRMNRLKNALKTNFTSALIPDGRIRLAWQSMHRCLGIPSDSAACGNNNGMKPLQGAHRTNFMNWVNTLDPNGGTPSHSIIREAGDYLKKTDLGINSPWANSPGTTGTGSLSCRKSFHIFLTDGEWNGKGSDGDRTSYPSLLNGNIDGEAVTLPAPDSQSYSVTSDQTRIYRDSWGFPNYGTTGKGMNTLADLAFYYWATDLQPGLTNNVKPIIKKPGSETFGSVVLDEYWNPKNDPAKWQHMTTYTIGFGTAAANWVGDPDFDATAGTYGGDFSALIQGTKQWKNPFCVNNINAQRPCKLPGVEDPGFSYPVSAAATTGARQSELWHMALNGRGKFYSAADGAALTNAFQDIIATIQADTSAPVTNFVGASASISRDGTNAYKSGFSGDGWTGYVSSDTVTAVTGVLVANTAWGTVPATPAPRQKTTADILDALDATGLANRLVLTTKSDTGAGVSFTWDNLHSTQQALLNTVDSVTDTKGSERVNYIRGDRTKESNQTGGYFRNRISRQGDIVNSNIWYTGKPVSDYNLSSYRTFANNHSNRIPMLYVGGNDGMLHGFSAINGEEKIAYVPKGIYKNIPLLTKTDYTHRFYVDGSPFTGDVNIGSSATADWRTYLFGGLGAGGKGYFVLDVTKPGYTGGSGQATNFTTASAAALVVMDKTADKDDSTSIDADIGHVFGDPVPTAGNQLQASQIAQMNNGRWAVVLGNGYNSTNEQAVLLIQYLDGDKSLQKIPVGTAGTNGLSTPRLLDVNGDGLPDIAYAGDLKGNLWKFNLFSSNPGDWEAAFSGSPLYSAVDASGTPVPQPITSAPTLAQNTVVGGLMVAFGTGRNITENDRTDTSVQSVYAVRDNTIYMPDSAASPANSKIKINTGVTPAVVGTGRSNLVQQSVNMPSVTAGQGASTGDNFYTLTNNPVNYGSTGTNPNKRGWYIDLPVSGERVLGNMEFFAGTGVLEIISKVPASGGNTEGETCEPTSTPEKTFRTFMSIQDGKRPTTLIMDVNGDSYFTNSDRTGGTASGDAFTRSNASNVELKISTGKKEKRIGADGKVRDLPTPPAKLLRPAWRQLQ